MTRLCPTRATPATTAPARGSTSSCGIRTTSDTLSTSSAISHGSVTTTTIPAGTPCGGGDAVDLPDVSFETLDHYLPLAEERVHQQRGVMSFVLDDDDQPLRGILGRSLDLEDPAEAQQRQRRLANDDHLTAVDRVDA